MKMRTQRTRRARPTRPGAVLVLVAVCLVAICAFVALAVDVGMIAVAKTEAQNAADVAAMVGARSLDGSDTPNLTLASNNARAAARANKVLHQLVQDSEITVQHGAYHYDTSSETFVPQYPPVDPDNYNLTRVTIRHTRGTAFARVLGIDAFTVVANATAAHRPRDVMIILDFSGSMNNESDLWNNEGYLGSANNSPNNNDPVFPSWGHHSASNAALQNTNSDPRVGKCNITDWALGLPPLAEDFYQHVRGASTTSKAFAKANASYATTPNGDGPPLDAAGNPAKTVQDITGSPTTPFDPANDAPYNNFQGFTQGPGYWGKTFFIWPPHPDPGDPNNNVPPKDWRRKFFFYPDGVTPLDDNSRLWTGDGNAGNGGDWRDPPGNYRINYAAILAWIKNTGPNPFPSMLRGGRILYYDAIPDDVPASAYDHSRSNSQISNTNQRFWKEYIDYVLGVWRDPFGNVRQPGSPACSMGPDFEWGAGTRRVNPRQNGLSNGPPNGTGAWNRIHPADSPRRPRHRFWFGPMTMVQFISDTGLLPGNAHDISMYPAKLGIASAIEDIRNNHPNDLVSLILFNRPRFDNEPAEAGRFSQAQLALSRNYTGMLNALWFPPNSASLDVRPWDANGVQTPRAYGDYTANTCSNYGFMLAYNQLSSSPALQLQGLGGLGRKGAQRLIVFETDGMANVAANAGFNATDHYYEIGPNDSVTPGGSAASGVYAVVDKIVALDTDFTNGPGFAKARKPVIIHCVAFGAVIEPTAQGTEPANVMTLLQNVSARGGTGFPASVTDSTHPDFYKLCTGTLDERKTKLRQAFRKIMESGVPVSLIE